MDLNGCDVYDERTCNRLITGAKAGVGLVNVTRGRRTDEGGYNWTITYRSIICDLPQVGTLVDGWMFLYERMTYLSSVLTISSLCKLRN